MEGLFMVVATVASVVATVAGCGGNCCRLWWQGKKEKKISAEEREKD
jgi:hypothetical protein